MIHKNAAFELSSGFGIFAVLILEKPHNTLALEGETVTLSCTTSDSKAPVTWRRNNTVLQAGLKYDLMDKGAFHQLCIHNLLPEDSGTYTCDTGDAQCDVSLTVEGNKGRVKKTLCSNLFYHNRVELLYIDILELQLDLNPICPGVPLYHKPLPFSYFNYLMPSFPPPLNSDFTSSTGSPVFFRKELKNQDAVEGEGISLRCELSKPGIRVEWRKGGMVIQPSKKYEMKQEGCIRELCIQNLMSEDSGYYTCDAGDQLTTAALAVQGSRFFFLIIISFSRSVIKIDFIQTIPV